MLIAFELVSTGYPLFDEAVKLLACTGNQFIKLYAGQINDCGNDINIDHQMQTQPDCFELFAKYTVDKLMAVLKMYMF